MQKVSAYECELSMRICQDTVFHMILITSDIKRQRTLPNYMEENQLVLNWQK